MVDAIQAFKKMNHLFNIDLIKDMAEAMKSTNEMAMILLESLRATHSMEIDNICLSFNSRFEHCQQMLQLCDKMTTKIIDERR